MFTPQNNLMYSSKGITVELYNSTFFIEEIKREDIQFFPRIVYPKDVNEDDI